MSDAQTTIDPCPLCRGRSELSRRLGEGWWQVICLTCGCRTGETKNATPEQVIARWNTREGVGQSYETALALARKLVEPPMFERDAIARCLFCKAMCGHAQWDEMAEPHQEDWRVRADAWILDVTNLIDMSKSFRATSASLQDRGQP